MKTKHKYRATIKEQVRVAMVRQKIWNTTVYGTLDAQQYNI